MSNIQARSDSYSQGLIIGFRMVQVAIGITVGSLMSILSQLTWLSGGSIWVGSVDLFVWT
jgi:hypothetical protein